MPSFPTLIARMTLGAALALSCSMPAQATADPPARSTIDELDTFMTVFERVKSRYVKSVDDHELIKGAIEGMLASLDPHSIYAEGADFSDLQTISNGNYGGVGVVSTIDRGLVRVVSTTEDGPAWKAGVKPGDFITRIDGKLAFGDSVEDVVDRMRGPPGTKVELTVRREGEPKPIVLSIVRSVIDVHPVKWEVRNGIGIINLNIFNGRSALETSEAIAKIKEATHGNPIGYILDLRNNGGGVRNEAVEIADMFLDSGEIVSQRGRSPDSNARFYARPGDLTGGRPLVVLVDSGSASASEIVAGALQDYHRALIVGERSFGKGSVQSVMRIGDEQALSLTTELYYLPSGRSIQGEGIEPDVVVPQLSDGRRDARVEVRESDLKRALVAEAKSESGDEELKADPPEPRFMITPAQLKAKGVTDFQLDYAVKILKRIGTATVAEGTAADKPGAARPPSA